MSGKIGLKFQWGVAKKKDFTSYPYWSIYLISGDNFKKKGYGTARANLSREAWRRFIVKYISYEKMIDEVMGRKPDFDVWLKETIHSLKQLSLNNFRDVIKDKVKTDMLLKQTLGNDYTIEYFSEVIMDE